MFAVRFGAVVALLFIVPLRGSAAEPSAKMLATVSLPEVEIRSGPSLKYPQTARLRKGQQVAIHHEDDQWYAILPPAGSISWVKHLFIGEFDPKLQSKQNAVITKDDYAVHVGSEIQVQGDETDPSLVTDVRQVKLPRGTIVEIIGPKYVSNNTVWYPITPPAGEFRYIAKAAVANIQPVQAPVSAKPNTSGIVSGNSDSVPAASNSNASIIANGAKIAHANWGEAELLHSQGRYVEAGKVYVQIYQELKERRAELEDLLTCLNRIDECKEKAKSPGGAANRDIPRTNPPSASLDNPSFRPSNPQPAPPPTRRDWPTSRSEERTDSTKVTANTDGALKSTGPGYLRRAPFFIDGNKQAYAVESNRGELIYYVTATSGVNLDSMIGKRVELLGTVVVKGDLRGAPYMIVSKANLAK